MVNKKLIPHYASSASWPFGPSPPRLCHQQFRFFAWLEAPRSPPPRRLPKFGQPARSPSSVLAEISAVPHRPAGGIPTRSIAYNPPGPPAPNGLRDAFNGASKVYTVMLRICCSQHWTLCGQLAGPWVQELRSCWDRARCIAAGSSSVVDLSDVTFIDEDGEKLLSEMRTAGVKFVATGVETKHVLENLKSRGEKSLRRLVGCWNNDTTKREKQ